MRVSDFDYELPEELIAQVPTPRRRDSRLLVLGQGSGRVVHRMFPDIVDHLCPDDLVVANDTRVIRGRFLATKPTGGRVEILIERILAPARVLAWLRCSRKPKVGTLLSVDGEGDGSGGFVVRSRREELFELEIAGADGVDRLIEKTGAVPLPPYIRRSADDADAERYQTVYARRPGAVAAPTAGLHFDETLLAALAQRGVEIAHVTLHVGAGTFAPIRGESVQSHSLHCEWVEVSEAVCEAIARARARGGRVVSIGTTTLRALESAAAGGEVRPMRGETELFVYPGYTFRCVDMLLTNFHLPRSSLLLLVCAFGGTDAVLGAYREAVARRYRFFSYGDAMLLERAGGAS
ncbi:MAG: tRNA preQ1(34) S-adenosylmethionine ribosyltransferase-isomerase QueA [Thiotrichales bacterium]|nr:tRNA preQ1(34) S-adenosylmethionine ribosyltransferase-isomerase QueA [Thiotrichales bacterium]MCY4350817.1 tRNA preQ1(34) S-adenosylmethionine ribosyltransferase-isomerase QueA [Thiotrichales bacterium]